MATYKEIRGWVKNKYGYQPRTCWIADVKEQCGLRVRRAWNRKSNKRMVPCPKQKVKDIKVAFRHFGMIE